MTDVIEAINNSTAQFGQKQPQAGNTPSWLTPLRKAARSRFEEVGFPTRKLEDWQYVNVNPIAETAYRIPSADDVVLTPEILAAQAFCNLPGHRIVLVNGEFTPHLSQIGSLPDGVLITTLSQAMAENAALLETTLGRLATFETNPFVALNTAYFGEGAFIYIPRSVVLEVPITIINLATTTETPGATHPRTLVIADENSQATVAECYLQYGDGISFSNAVTEIVCAANAVLDHYKITQTGAESYHTGTTQVQLAATGNFASHNITLEGAIVRHDSNAIFTASGAECTLNGLYLARGKQLVANFTSIDHAVPHCNSHELYKGILDDRSRGVFTGKIYVRIDAQKTDAKQTNKTLLLSKEATINTKPQLEIFADDVRCTHGATIGQLDAESLFYLRARGIDIAEARSLLTYAFASDVIDRIKFDALRTEIHKALFSHLPQEIRAED